MSILAIARQVGLQHVNTCILTAARCPQSHMSRLPAPISDYVTDTRGALDNSVRLLQAITDLAADAGWLETTLSTMLLIQSLMQVRHAYPSWQPFTLLSVLSVLANRGTHHDWPLCKPVQ